MTTHSEPPIVVGIDGSSVSLDALRWAARTAARHHVPLHLVYAVGAPLDFGPGLGTVVIDNQLLRADGEAALVSAEKVAREIASDLEISTVVADPAPATVLIERSKAARMVVVGTHGLGAIRRGLLGSVSTSLARHAHCPVAVIPEAPAESRDRTGMPVVVGIDGSPCSMQAIAIAFAEASHRGVGLVAVTTWSEFFRRDSHAEIQEQARALQAESLAGQAEQYPDVPVTRVVAEGRPARRLMNEADGAQLIVVGSHGRNGFAGMTLGSVGQAVLHSTTIPLVIARPRD